MNSNLVVEASAHGRLDVMGGIADYSGSLVLQMPIREKTVVQIRLRADSVCTFRSHTESGEILRATVDYKTYLLHNQVDYSFAQASFKKNKEYSWIAYVLGCALVLQKEKGITFGGADFTIESSIPLGKGVSSSASIEVATMKALVKAFAITLTGTELPILAQRVENLIVGAPCGLMDQLSCYFGEPRKLLPIVCQPDQIQPLITIPNDIHFFGIDSGVRHSVGGSSYADVRCATFMGYTIIAQSLGANQRDIQKAKERKDYSSLPFGGYLCNITVEDFANRYRKLLPHQISGKEFISAYGDSLDSITAIDENTQYDIATCTRHPIYENERVHRFKELIALFNQKNNSTQTKVLEEMGELMYQSHESYSHCGLGSERTDEIVTLARNLNSSIFGAKITGGGSGGTVCILATGIEGKESVLRLHQALSAKYKKKIKLFES